MRVWIWSGNWALHAKVWTIRTVNKTMVSQLVLWLWQLNISISFSKMALIQSTSQCFYMHRPWYIQRPVVIRSPVPYLCYCYCQDIVFDWKSYAKHLSNKLLWQVSGPGILQLFQLLCSEKYNIKYSENLQWINENASVYNMFCLDIVIRQWRRSWLVLLRIIRGSLCWPFD